MFANTTTAKATLLCAAALIIFLAPHAHHLFCAAVLIIFFALPCSSSSLRRRAHHLLCAAALIIFCAPPRSTRLIR
jgi:flagellar biosynthesis protein FliR